MCLYNSLVQRPMCLYNSLIMTASADSFFSRNTFTLWLLSTRIFQALANNSPAGRFHQIDGVVLTKFDTIDTKVFGISQGGAR